MRVIFNRMIYVTLAATLGALIVFTLTTSSVSEAQSPQGWSEPITLGDGWFPDVAADPTGRTHIVWASSVSPRNNNPDTSIYNYDTVMYQSTQNGRDWSEPVDIIALPTIIEREATRPTILIDQQGTFHITYRFTTVYYAQAPVQLVTSASSWLSPRRISGSQTAYFSDFMPDKQGRLHLVYTENVSEPAKDCLICYHLFYRYSDNNGLNWSNLTDISNLSTGSAKPQILVDDQDNIHAVWDAGYGGAYGQVSDPTKVMYAASYDRGRTWITPLEFVPVSGTARNISIGLDGENKLMVVWLNIPDDIVFYQLSNDQGRSWTPPRPIPGILGGYNIFPSRLDNYVMGTDSAGNVHLVLIGRTNPDREGLDLLHLSWDGSTWSEPEAITTLIGDVPEWPRLAIGNGNQLHVVWFVRNKEAIWDSDNGEYFVQYAHGSSSAPAATPASWPTPTPTLTPPSTPTPVATPTYTPSPTPVTDPSLAQVSIPSGATDTIYTDTDELMLMIKSLIPATLIIVAVVVTVRLWRR